MPRRVAFDPYFDHVHHAGHDAAALAAAIQETAASSKKDMGKVIKAVQAKAAGRAEGKTISELVSKMLP